MNLEKKIDAMTTIVGDLEKTCQKLSDEAKSLASEVTNLPKTLPSPIAAPTSSSSSMDIVKLADQLKLDYEKMFTPVNYLKVHTSHLDTRRL